MSELPSSGGLDPYPATDAPPSPTPLSVMSQFDDFMDRVGLPRRSREYDLEVEVSATVRVTLTATSEKEAADALTRDDVWAVLGEDNITWDVCEVYAD